MAWVYILGIVIGLFMKIVLPVIVACGLVFVAWLGWFVDDIFHIHAFVYLAAFLDIAFLVGVILEKKKII